ncbi:hypothetical protein L5515_015470 [Caenorhabditis briggsae]|uniref:Uncharacterized protein n=1 Tax=Caenorhabditis briggsae TaxID=6238 RepID=A0AAE9JA68_CAEBR|nr:hypothetical protein L5515_015470 [Caenorhabditis briggsae]
MKGRRNETNGSSSKKLSSKPDGSAPPVSMDPMTYLEDQCFELAQLYHIRRDLAIPPHMAEFQSSNHRQTSPLRLPQMVPEAVNLPVGRQSQEYSEEKEIYQTDNSSPPSLDGVGPEIAQDVDPQDNIESAGNSSRKINSRPGSKRRNSEQPFDPLPWLFSESESSDSESDVLDEYSPDKERKRRKRETDRRRRQRIRREKVCKPSDTLECPDKDHDNDKDPEQG